MPTAKSWLQNLRNRFPAACRARHSRIPLVSPETASTISHRAARLETALRKVIRGKDDIIRLAVVSLLARGHLLIEGVPGVGKTTLGQAIARALDCSFQRVQFTSDMLPSDVLGISIYSAIEQQFEFKRGPVFTNVLLADEINRTTPKTQSALLEAMNEGQVTVDAHSYPLPQPFLVIATQNPVEHHGTYPLPESQLDRFLMRVRMGYPDSNAEREILRSEAGSAKLEELRPALTGTDLLEMQHALTQVRVDDSLVSYALAVVKKTRDSEHFSLGVSPRGSQMLYRAAQAMAFLDGRNFCTPEDFKPLMVPVFAHRVVVSGTYASTLKKSEQAEQVMQEIVESTPVPM
jgi:MoxR-like ATPase